MKRSEPFLSLPTRPTEARNFKYPTAFFKGAKNGSSLPTHPTEPAGKNPFGFELGTVPVSYTHLDVYKRQEYQRKDGRYRFRYIDEDGKEKNVYSWRLDKNDPMPKGKKREPSLRRCV